MAGGAAQVADPRASEALDAYAALLQACRIIQARVERFLLAAGLTPTQFAVMAALLRGGPLGQRELTRQVMTSAGNMTDLVDKLEARGLVRRARGERDRRAVQVALTQAGRDLISPLALQHAAEIAAAMTGLEPDELQRLDSLLRRLSAGAAEHG